MQTNDGVPVVYVGRPGLWGNPYRSHSALARVPATDLVTPWEYEGRSFADGAEHHMVWPGGEASRHVIRYMTVQEIIATYRRALIAPHKGLRLVKHRGDEAYHITVEMVRRELAGKHLACWCRLGTPCHGDVLVWAANAPLDEVKQAIEREYETLRAFAERVAALHPEVLAARPAARDAGVISAEGEPGATSRP